MLLYPALSPKACLPVGKAYSSTPKRSWRSLLYVLQQRLQTNDQPDTCQDGNRQWTSRRCRSLCAAPLLLFDEASYAGSSSLTSFSSRQLFKGPSFCPSRAGFDPSEAEIAYPCCDIALWWHELELPEGDTTPERRAEAKAKLLEKIEKDAMSPLYRKAVEAFGWSVDEEKMKAMEAQHEKELEALELRLADAKENYGDTEVKDALLAKAQLLCRIGDISSLPVPFRPSSPPDAVASCPCCACLWRRVGWGVSLQPRAVEAYGVAYSKTVGIGSRLDITLTLLRIGFVFRDRALVRKHLIVAKE
ncbi:26s proteasome regulatory complex [Cyclospora cayetanensis]|uniref:26s proteasome regulatory complex n=1 Tax=Cyclospora cayetanensis TaxID=88456 RepID=A0A1D3CYG9_9EIME|nr:26s proteasome regulatory complex [Cyclospora cayetanensis]